MKTQLRDGLTYHRMLAMSLVMGLTAWALAGCGSSSAPAPPPLPGIGALYTFVADTPFCDVLTLRPSFTKLSLIPRGGGAEVCVFCTTPSIAPSIKVNFAGLRDFTTILNLSNVPEGIYDQANLEFSTTQLVVFDASQSPPATVLNPTLSTTSPKVSITPPLQIVKDKVSALRVEFDLVQSISVDSQGQVTGGVTPTFRLSAVTASGAQGFGEMDDLVGFIRSVTTTGSTTDFTGSFLLQLLAGSQAPAVTVNLKTSTQLFGATALNQVPTGSFVEVDGFVDSNGNMVANSIEVEDRTDVGQQIAAFIGLITSVTRDPVSGNLIAFNLFVSETQPDMPFDIPLDSTVVVNVSPTTGYQFSSRATNFANLPFDQTSVVVGQEVVTHGKFTKSPPSPTTVDADKVFLKLQTLQGNFSTILRADADNLTGAFGFAPCPSFLRATRVIVFTNNQTAFVNLNGLNGLTPQATLLLKGLPFFSRLGGMIQNVQVPPNTLVFLAKQVHQI